MNRPDHQKMMEEIIEMHQRNKERPSLLLHACCAPCASGCFERLIDTFALTFYYYNPNITDRDEYEKRAEELQRLRDLINADYGTDIVCMRGPYEPELFLSMAKGLEDVPEGGERCFLCYEGRLQKTAEFAAANGYDYFATTLTLSPLKNAAKINEIGERVGAAFTPALKYLPSDFKKKDGYKRSVELSAKYGLYRQNFCGCDFSRPDGRIRT